MAKARNILLVVDPASTEQPAVARGMAVARSLGLGLELLACAHEGHPTALPRSIDPRKARRAVLCSQLEKLRSLAQGCTGIEVTTKAVWDRPLHEAIIRETLRSEPRLVMKDSRFHSAISRALITNTDWHLIRDCPAPLWLVRGPAWSGQPRLAAFVDPHHEHDKPADLDHRILTEATTLARELDGEVHAVHCHESEALPADFCVPCAGPEALALYSGSRSEHEGRLHKLATAHGIPPPRTHLRRGPPAGMIPAVTRELDVQLAVMGAVARSRLAQAFIGSTTEHVLDQLSCDVLVIKPAHFDSAVTYRAQAADFMEMHEPASH